MSKFNIPKGLSEVQKESPISKRIPNRKVKSYITKALKSGNVSFDNPHLQERMNERKVETTDITHIFMERKYVIDWK